MGHRQLDRGQTNKVTDVDTINRDNRFDDFVLEKNIFSNIFEKDIRRVFIYKKAEQLAKAIHLITPAFTDSLSLKNRIDAVAVGLIDAAVCSPGTAREALSRELLALSSLLSIARTGNILSSMNVDLISREVRVLLHEVASYEEPTLLFDTAPTLSAIAKNVSPRSVYKMPEERTQRENRRMHKNSGEHAYDVEGIPDRPVKDRRETILSVIKNKGTASIKDFSTLFRDISEKTIQRELSALIALGVVLRQGERRWSSYSLA
ncbi:DeoR family transcriptional regulator [Candidatus Uhrbacteria bacterium]|nr:DeoR family transcriptional regulator [Candidatus Uhrbacteria bacterium]